MKAKFELGAEIDFLTRKELDEALRSWQRELVRGIRPRVAHAQGVVAAGAWTVGDGSRRPGDDTGPDRNMAWAVTNVAVSGTAIAAGDLWSVWSVRQAPSSLIARNISTHLPFARGSLVLHPDEWLTLGGPATGTGNEVWVSIRAVEAPIDLLWMLVR